MNPFIICQNQLELVKKYFIGKRVHVNVTEKTYPSFSGYENG